MSDHVVTLSSGRKLGFAEHGDPAGIPTFFFHGWPSARLQGALMDAVGKKYGLRIVSPDRPGIGLSDFQPNRRLLDWPETLSELADHIGARQFHVFGWSGGGPYVLVTALAMPERLLSASIICSAPPLQCLGDQYLFWPYRLMIRMRHGLPFMLGFLLRMGKTITRGNPDRPPLRWLIGMMQGEDRRVLSDPQVFALIRDSQLEALRRGPKSVIADADVYLSDWGFDLRTVRHPIHFWHGKADRNISWRYSEQMAMLVPGATTHWLENDGHYSLAIRHAEAIVRHALGHR